MLCLREKVGGNVGRGAAAVVDHQDFARPGDHINADLSEHQFLGGGDINIARPGDLVDLRDCGGTVS